MAKYIKTFAEYITEAATWDDTKKKKVDANFISFDKDEAYEPEYFVKAHLPVINKITGKNITKEELISVLKGCKDKVAHNHPKKQILQCVAAHYDIDIRDVQTK